ncbi:membrane fusion protein, multidrug efflux system [Nitrosospira sp. Nsp18]|uniref:efflux RND transporter periplasmic adaptor subunit n=1 Tax=Nitrosospira sp. Nsp18 TaxID=1855334 RepID=UPI000886553A|nr:efflux RND transporter periplasmic adaptor subunit [Nitrosospira sp. Nsp18]SDA15600.1 membrane fusion protein, multidrug efflux system [Nitrosospira sp. Nsp18]
MLLMLLALTGCGDQLPATSPPPAMEVTTVTVSPRDTPVQLEFVAETQSSRQVEIRARVEGFLEKRLYTEGELVKAGQKMYQMDQKPFQAALQSAKGQLAQQEAALAMAQATLARVRPLTEKNALSKKNLDDTIGMVQQAQAAVFAAQGEVTTAELNLSYTTLYSPLTGLSSFSKKHEGSYLSTGADGLLTYVAQLDPIWVNFSVSENQMLKYRGEVEHGLLRFPSRNLFEVAITLADGSVYPHLGRINFSEPSFSQETGTFLVRTLFANPEGNLRPGQFVRVQLRGAVRPNSILLPQRAVLQGAKGHYVWVVDGEGKAARREVEIGDWQGEGWFISNGLLPGEQVVVDGAIRLTPGSILKIVDASAPMSAATGVSSGPAGGPEGSDIPGSTIENTVAAPPGAPGSTSMGQ